MTDDKKKREARISLVVDIEKLDHVQGNDFFMITSATLAKGDRPLSNQQIKIFIDGVESEPLITDQEHGRVLYEVEFSTISKSVSVEARQTGFNTRSPRISRILPWPERKKENETNEIKLEIMATRDSGDNLNVTLVRLEKNGKGSSGQICYIDQDPTPQTIQTDPFGIAILSLVKRTTKRRVLVFLPEKPIEKIRVDVIALRNNGEENGKPISPMESLSERMFAAFNQGRQKKKKGGLNHEQQSH
jgi:hypothetical protein